MECHYCDGSEELPIDDSGCEEWGTMSVFDRLLEISARVVMAITLAIFGLLWLIIIVCLPLVGLCVADYSFWFGALVTVVLSLLSMALLTATACLIVEKVRWG